MLSQAWKVAVRTWQPMWFEETLFLTQCMSTVCMSRDSPVHADLVLPLLPDAVVQWLVGCGILAAQSVKEL